MAIVVWGYIWSTPRLKLIVIDAFIDLIKYNIKARRFLVNRKVSGDVSKNPRVCHILTFDLWGWGHHNKGVHLTRLLCSSPWAWPKPSSKTSCIELSPPRSKRSDPCQRQGYPSAPARPEHGGLHDYPGGRAGRAKRTSTMKGFIVAFLSLAQPTRTQPCSMTTRISTMTHPVGEVASCLPVARAHAMRRLLKNATVWSRPGAVLIEDLCEWEARMDDLV